MLEFDVVRAVSEYPDEGLTGRRKILSPVRNITAENVVNVLGDVLGQHNTNVAEINYLWDYYRGKQDIRYKEKYVREDINNKVTINRANEIVTFKTAYLLNEPIQYVSKGGSDELTAKISTLNEYMTAEDKASKDKEIVDWMHICGVGERLVLTDEMAGEKGGAPYYIYTIDPRYAFVIYSAAIGQKPLAGVIIMVGEDGQYIYNVYTENMLLVVTGDKVTAQPHPLGAVPLVEYINNEARMGAFEVVISILNNINTLASNAVDGVQDFVNAFDVFQNCEIGDGEYEKLSQGGKAVMVKTVTQGMEAKVYRIASELNQNGVQQQIDNLEESYLTICGMPNRNGGSSTSDTGQAVIFRDGWSEAESRAKDTEKLFSRSERRFLSIVLAICRDRGELDLDIKDIGINFARKSLNNLQSRFQCLVEGLASDNIAPKCLFDAFGDIFGDKNEAYILSKEWREKREAEELELLNAELDRERDRVSNGNTAV